MFNTNNAEKKEVRPNYEGDFTVSRVRVLSDKVLKFNLNLCNGTISLYDCSIIAYKDKKTSEDKIFFTFPNNKGKNGVYYLTCFARLTDEMKDEIIKQVLSHIKS